MRHTLGGRGRTYKPLESCLGTALLRRRDSQQGPSRCFNIVTIVDLVRPERFVSAAGLSSLVVTSAAGLETMEISGQASATAAEDAAHVLTAPLRRWPSS
jgi:hypothetical protein